MNSDIDTPDRIALLEKSVFQLMREVEALRTAMIELCRNRPATLSEDALACEAAGIDGPHTIYGKAYLETAWLTHWSAGNTSGEEKLRERFSLEQNQFDSLSELSMLERLGYSDQHIRNYIDSARAAEICT